jgi:tetraacyldisaccharide 4'-kinase
MILTFLSLIYCFFTFWRNVAFDLGLLKTCKFDVPVISVGNIAAGGTGKTPLTLLLTEILKDKFKIAIISRGYGVKLTDSRLVECGADPKTYGDEAVLFKRHFPEVLYFVGPNRCRSAQMAIECGAQLIIMDDGFQHRYLHRDYDIVVLDGKNPFGGFLRESPMALKRAGLIVVSHTEEELDLCQYTQAPVVYTDIEVKNVIMHNKEHISLQNKKVALFCGIGNPRSFVHTVEKLGATIIKKYFTFDHKTISKNKLIDLSQGVDYVVCTEKDIVKIRGCYNLPIAYVEIALKIIQGEAELRFFLPK